MTKKQACKADPSLLGCDTRGCDHDVESYKVVDACGVCGGSDNCQDKIPTTILDKIIDYSVPVDAYRPTRDFQFTFDKPPNKKEAALAMKAVFEKMFDATVQKHKRKLMVKINETDFLTPFKNNFYNNEEKHPYRLWILGFQRINPFVVTEPEPEFEATTDVGETISLENAATVPT